MPEEYTRPVVLEIEQRSESAPQKFNAVLSTETPVRRRDYSGEYDEVLSHSANAIDLSRSPIPLIEVHDREKLPVGVVEDLRIQDRKLRGSVRFSKGARGQELEADARDGIGTSLSIGYQITAYRDQESKNGVTVRTATKWQPFETSLVSVPADPNAGLNRAAERIPMPETQEPTGTNTNETQPTADAIRIAVETERERCKTIRLRAKCAHLEEEFADDLIQRGIELDHATHAIKEEMLKRDAAIFKPRGSSINVSGGEGIRSHSENIVKDLVSGRMGAIELARNIVGTSGFGGNNQNLIKRAMTTSDFPQLISGAANQSLRNGFAVEAATHREWVALDEVKNFLDNSRPILGAAPDLELKLEHGEYKHGSMDDDAALYRIATYGRIVSLTREVLVNDQLGAFLRLFPAMGQAAMRKEADLVYSMFAENSGAGPTMQDSNPLFDAAHNNVTATGPFDAALLAAGRLLLRKMTGVGGGILGLRPAALVCPAEVEHEAELLLAAASRVVSTTLESDVTPWIKDLKLVVEPRLAEDAAFLVADSSQVDSAVLGLLEGQAAPYLEEKEEFETDIRLFKVRHDCGAKFLDWRGIVKMPIGEVEEEA